MSCLVALPRLCKIMRPMMTYGSLNTTPVDHALERIIFLPVSNKAMATITGLATNISPYGA